MEKKHFALPAVLHFVWTKLARVCLCLYLYQVVNASVYNQGHCYVPVIPVMSV